MSEIKNLLNEEAAKKLKSLAEDIDICLFCTNLSTSPATTRPMGVAKADDHGNLWFLSPRSSAKNAEINADNRVQLFFSKMSDSEYLSVYGVATIYTDQQTINDVWKPIANAWFKDGKDDPNVSVIKVTPSEAQYWDTKDGRFISLAKIAMAALTGIHSDGGIEGTLRP